MARSSAAYDFEYFEGTRSLGARNRNLTAVSSRARNNTRAAAVVGQKPKVHILRTVLIVALFVASAMLILYSNVKLNETDVEINNATALISDLKSKNQKLEMKLSQTFSPNNIELIATTELGMIRTQVAHVEYFSVPSKNIVSLKNEDKGIISKILKLF